MTTHPEAAMTREQVLEAAWCKRGNDPTVRNDRASFLIFQAGFDAALASTKQEPAADAEEVAHKAAEQIVDELDEMVLHFRVDRIQTIITAALRRYTDDVWQPIETAPHGVLVLVGWNDTMGVWNAETAYASQGWRRNGVSTMSRHGHATHWMPLPEPPAARASGEKGGAR